MASNLEFMWRGSELFYSANFLMELMFILIAVTISILSYKAYKFTHKKNYFYLFLSFILLSGAYLIRTLDNVSFFSQIPIQTQALFFNVVFVLYLVLTIFSYLVLMISFLDIKDSKITFVLFTLAFLLVFSSYKTIGVFYLTSALFLFFVIDHLYMNYIKNRSYGTLLLFIAFLLIFIVQLLSLMFKMKILIMFNNLSFSVLQLVLMSGYLLIIIVLARIYIMKNAVKKR